MPTTATARAPSRPPSPPPTITMTVIGETGAQPLPPPRRPRSLRSASRIHTARPQSAYFMDPAAGATSNGSSASSATPTPAPTTRAARLIPGEEDDGLLPPLFRSHSTPSLRSMWTPTSPPASPATSPRTRPVPAPAPKGPAPTMRRPRSFDDGPASPTRGGTTPRARAVLDEILHASANFYEVLGVSPTASHDEIRRAYLQKSRDCHPDKHHDHADVATAAFQTLTTAYSTLRQPHSRALYDASLRHQRTSSSSSATPEPPVSPTHLAELVADLWNELMRGNLDHLALLVHLARPHLGRDTLEQLVTQVHDLLLAAHTGISAARPALDAIADVQVRMAALGYLDVPGRVRLTMLLLRHVLSIPTEVQAAMGVETLPPWSVTLLKALVDVLDKLDGGRG
ncbi:hypothetical protein AMAG_01088 [Allomyces macrogynus ATCC 38327]|uniref:J domain-containing protein n=1 Tax=Allomyces macrogynus (strain ATCC 38327) TaxID=578462 RepID=A0A0L0RYL3_ALLM3|nr:hypothetical protein AMAG_01088 [Allomyces macrogynus ATCC 38327]|eukprot:KNE55169.1 hypothetical protein AMAG_01088 [Allomyces macrogynus ATCC 38327]